MLESWLRNTLTARSDDSPLRLFSQMSTNLILRSTSNAQGTNWRNLLAGASRWPRISIGGKREQSIEGVLLREEGLWLSLKLLKRLRSVGGTVRTVKSRGITEESTSHQWDRSNLTRTLRLLKSNKRKRRTITSSRCRNPSRSYLRYFPTILWTWMCLRCLWFILNSNSWRRLMWLPR
jgi:hypothetical protein